MRALAEYVMRGRREALLVSTMAVVLPMFFWLGAAVVGLVTLRKGVREGAFVGHARRVGERWQEGERARLAEVSKRSKKG